MSAQQQWGALEADERDGHLRKRPPSNVGNPYAGDPAPAEFWCHDCNARVTVSPDEKREYGHRRGCEHAIERHNNWQSEGDG